MLEGGHAAAKVSPSMGPLTIDAKALEGYLPHRGPNLMPDLVEVDAAGTSTVSRTTVPAGDPRGRTVFMRTGGVGAPCWYEPFLAELLALSGLPMLKSRLGEDRIAVFSMISRFAFAGTAPLGATITVRTRITRDRGAFTVYEADAEADGRKFLAGEIVSGIAPRADLAGLPAEPGPAPASTRPIDDADFAWKPRSLRFVDALVEEDAAQRRVVCSYAYPSDHVFVPGHFPGAPVMMGVTQWTAIADAAWVACRRFGLDGRVIAQGSIATAAGADVCDVRDLEFVVEDGVPRIVAMKRLAFRSPVVPGQRLLVRASVAGA